VGKPLIGLTGRRWPASALGAHLPAAMRALHFDLHFADYPASVAAAGGLPVELARDADVDGVIERLDGLVLSGGADLDPGHYGADHDPDLGAVEQDRDEWEFALLRAARQRSLPVLAICRGLQLVNVAFGGSLNQHVTIDEGAGHPQWDVDGRSATHDVRVVPGSLTSTLLPESWPVNSLHHQTVERVGAGLVVSARATDGVVEGLETPEGDVLAVQWHPELLAKPDPTFAWLVREANDRRSARVGS
jgi:putative glutamine amidotransferase